MKRSNSAPCLIDDEFQLKKVKVSDEETNTETDLNAREYLQLALARVLELQDAVKDNTYFENSSSAIDDSDTDEDVMRDVLTKVFKDLPGSSSSVSTIIETATHKLPSESQEMSTKSVQLSGYNTCRKVTLDFMKTSMRNISNNQSNDRSNQDTRRRETVSSDYEIRARMLRGLDLHLAIKQRDYAYKLMRL